MVERYNLTYTLSGRAGVGSTANLVQFPLRLAHALTAHKTQGQTYKMPMTITVDLRDVFEGTTRREKTSKYVHSTVRD